jgi:DtxR family Mn-dependent transcriptional regulator
MPSKTEENYLKAIFKLSANNGDSVSTNNMAAELQTSAASVSDMLKRLAEKGLINYEKYRGVQLTKAGRTIAVNLIRSHRLWEVFLVDKLQYKWDQVHDLAEELEHIYDSEMLDKMHQFLGYPTHDPHGDPIPDADGKIVFHEPTSLTELLAGEKGLVVKVDEQSADFLQYLDRLQITIGSRIDIDEFNDYDNSQVIRIDGGSPVFISEKVGKNLILKRV